MKSRTSPAMLQACLTRIAPRLATMRAHTSALCGTQALALALLAGWLALPPAAHAHSATTSVAAPAATAPQHAAAPRLLVATAPSTVEPASATETPPAEPIHSERTQCLQECAIASGQCNSEVRQARQECSRSAANAGRDPLSMRKDDYAYFCSYFTNPGRCAFGDCQRRFSGHLNLCLNVMQKNIAAMRHDCFRNERDAQRICRTELRACEATCPK